MSDHTFTLKDGREVSIEYYNVKDLSRYSIIIDGKQVERNIPCGFGWNQNTIEEKVRKKYEKNGTETPKISSEELKKKTATTIERCTSILEKYDTKRRKKSSEIRRADFKLEGLLCMIEVKLKRVPSEITDFFKAAEELKKSINMITELATQTNNKALQKRTEEIKKKYADSEYFNY